MPAAIHHINWLVNDIESSVKRFSLFLQQQAKIEYLPGRNVDTARFALGDAWLVLVAPRDKESAVGKILELRGEGLFLLSLTGLNDLSDEQLSQMDTAGVREGLDDWKVWDISGLSTDTSILQLHKT